MKIITIAGRVGKDGEARRTQNGDPVLGFPVAVDDGYGENKSTMWFDVSVFGKRGSALATHIKKGMALTVSGDLSRREHEGKTYLSVRANEVTLQGGGDKGESRPRETSVKQDRDDPRTVAGRAYAPLDADLDDEIPF